MPFSVALNLEYRLLSHTVFNGGGWKLKPRPITNNKTKNLMQFA